MKLQISYFKRKSIGENIFDVLNISVMVLLCAIIIYPLWYCIVISFNDGADALFGGIYWWPRKFSVDSYVAVFKNPGIVTAFGISLARTVIGTFTHILFVAMAAYALTKKRLIGRNFYLTMGLITMFFNGGLIPLFLVIRRLYLLDNFLVYIIPTLFNFFHAIIFMAFFRELPASIEESAMMDGANDMTIFFRIILPLSKPIIATIALFQGVWHWNDFFFGVIYITNNQFLQPIATYLFRVIAEAGSSSMLANMPGGLLTTTVTTSTIKLATMVVATFPIMCVYPFLQKYFMKGFLIGSVKG